jgi:hypothetical protein
MSHPEQWAPGDRVEVHLPYTAPGRIRHQWRWFPGTVRGVNTAPHPGVHVDLDQLVNGVTYCYATHGELRRCQDRAGKS